MRHRSIVLCLIFAGGPVGAQTGAQTSDLARAAAVWERAITAKGGRDQLYKVQNLLISTHHDAIRGAHRTERLLAFPDRYWIWHDHRPPATDYLTEMYNLDQTVCWSVRATGTPQSICPNDLSEFEEPVQLAYLLETPWVKPRPVRAWTAELERGGGTVPLLILLVNPALHRHRVEIVRTVWRIWTIDYYLDAHSWLPLRVLVTHTGNAGFAVGPKAAPGELQLRVGDYSYRFSDYRAINGVQMPTAESTGPGSWDAVSCLTNVTYYSQLFRRAPTLEAGPDGWKHGTP